MMRKVNMIKKATPEEAGARTFVYWDIKRFPVPPGFDARRIRPCLAHFLERYGYCGPLTINAVGILTNVHDDILEALSSTGVNLRYAPFGTASLMGLMHDCIYDNPPPANILSISNPMAFPYAKSGFNLFGPFSYSSLEEDAISWIKLILSGMVLFFFYFFSPVELMKITYLLLNN
ncbi:PREDICTED: uncharacterized protein LOC109129551 [Camelina sativa]|uniref:Uncharacterized protein LOC109129551 n=1 Tax=Camelina sativa TaxID=90675 RepID=A0ABM1R303_CAMSA|nr:PREDICTED: uncharacterized protein LOC109129551 [Camelina sativa]